MDPQWIYATVILPIVGWGWSVEQRIWALGKLKEDIENANKKLDKLIDHLEILLLTHRVSDFWILENSE